MPHDEFVLLGSSSRVRNVLVNHDSRIEILEQTVIGANSSTLVNLVTDLGAIGDGTIHALSERYATLQDAQQIYPEATSLTQSIDWAALQTGITNKRRIYVPPGDFILDEEIVVSTQVLFLFGDNYGSFVDDANIQGDVSLGDRPMFRQTHGWVDLDNQLRDPDGNILIPPQPSPDSTMTMNIQGIRFTHRGVAHAGVFMFNIVASSSVIKECYFSHGDGRGIAIGAGFGVKYDTCRFLPDYADEFVSDEDSFKRVALIPGGHSAIVNCDFVRCGTCIALGGPGVNVLGGRFEVNVYGIIIGEYPTLIWDRIGENNQWRAASLNGVTLEQNRYAIEFGQAIDCSVRNLSVQGSETPGGVISKIGINFIAENQNVLIENTSVATNLSDFQNYVFNSPTKAKFKNIINAISITSVFNDSSGSEGYDFLGEHRGVGFQAKSDLVARGLTQIALDKELVFAKKLAGVETPANSATSVSVVFAPTIGTGTAAFTGPGSAVSDPGSTLAPATYEYATTLLNRLGETGIDDTLTVRTLTIATQEKAVLDFSPNTNSTFRRIYRRIEGSPVWDVYFEFASSLTSFEDTGQTEDGEDAPPVSGNIVPTEIEDDANYYVTPSTSWLTTCRITNKLTTGFDIEFGTAAPTGAEEVAWLLFRV